MDIKVNPGKACMNIEVDLNTNGHFRRKLEVLRGAIDYLIDGLGGIDRKYCAECGGVLTVVKTGTQFDAEFDTMECVECGERYAFKVHRGGDS